MCLDVVYRGKRKKEALAKLPDEFPVWKRLSYWCNNPDPVWRTWAEPSIRVYSGEMKAPYLGTAYGSPHSPEQRRLHSPIKGERAYPCGWHAYITRQDRSNTRCLAKKQHIRAIGEQDGEIVVVLSHITFPNKCGKRKENYRERKPG